jgi:hypothetical protein
VTTFHETPRETVASVLKHIELQVKTAAHTLRPRETQWRVEKTMADYLPEMLATVEETLDHLPTRDPYTGEIARPTRRFMCLLHEALCVVRMAEESPETHDPSFRPFVDDLVRTVGGLAQTPDELVEFYQAITAIEEELG